MRRSSDRAGTEPLAALVAVAAVTAGLTFYAGALPLPASPSEADNAAETVLERSYDATTDGGIVEAARLDPLISEIQVPAGWEANVTIRSGPFEVHSGPPTPPDVTSASRRISVRHGPTEVRPGRLRAVVWR